jgi:hypothetical protein
LLELKSKQQQQQQQQSNSTSNNSTIANNNNNNGARTLAGNDAMILSYIPTGPIGIAL